MPRKKKVVKKLYMYFGVVCELISDNGKELTLDFKGITIMCPKTSAKEYFGEE